MHAQLQQASGHVAGMRRTIRWASARGAPWVHAEDLCNALGWQRPERVLRALQAHIGTASVLGVQAGSEDDKFLCRAGCQELFARRTGGSTHEVKNLVRAKIFQEGGVDYESEVDVEEPQVDPQDEPMIPMADAAAMEQFAHFRAETNLMRTQALIARAKALEVYREMGGDTDHPEYEPARQTLLAEMRRPYPSQYISIVEYLQFQGFPEASALQLASVFGPDVKRAYRAEHGRDPWTYDAVFQHAASRGNVCIYDRFTDCELLGSCWRSFQRHRSWFKERYPASAQRMVDQRRLVQMSHGTSNGPAPGWGPARTQALADYRHPPF